MLLTLSFILRQEELDNLRPFVSRLQRFFRNRRCRRITRRALLDPDESPFMKMFNSGCMQSMITYTGFDHESFNLLLDLFQPKFDSLSPYSTDGTVKRIIVGKGRHRKINATQGLGLVLAWTRSKGEFIFSFVVFSYSCNDLRHSLLFLYYELLGNVIPLQFDFGLSHSCLTLWLKFGIRIVCSVLSNHPLAWVRMPTPYEVASFQQASSAKYPLLHEVWGTCDGLKLDFESTDSDRIQRMYYNGWTHGHYISNIFVFAMDGTIRICGLNAPGSMHDSNVADYSAVYDKLEKIFLETGGKVVVDTAFRLGHGDFLIKSSQQVLGDGIDADMAHDATSIRQSAEWGMAQFQASFPRVTDKIKFEVDGERRILLRTFVHLFNFRTNCVGCNQIRSVFMPHLEAEWFNVETMFADNE
jgi:hypothetical protein